jgi:hypothetical protein
MKKLIFAVMIFGILGMQCRNQKTLTMPSQPERKLINTNTFIGEMKEPDFNIKTAQISGDILYINVEFTGEKGQHDFDLLWDGSIMKSMPPKVTLTPVHKSENTSGKKKVEMQLAFNVSLLGERGSNTVIIMLKDYPEHLTWKKEITN